MAGCHLVLLILHCKTNTFGAKAKIENIFYAMKALFHSVLRRVQISYFATDTVSEFRGKA